MRATRRGAVFERLDGPFSAPVIVVPNSVQAPLDDLFAQARGKLLTTTAV